MTWESIDHSILSPSGRVSGRARKAALKRAAEDLFGPDGMQRPGLGPQPSESESLLRQAAELRALAARGMKPRAYLRRAEELERQAKGAQP